MMCLVFPGYMKSNYNLKCVSTKKKFSLSYNKLSETCLCENAIFSIPAHHWTLIYTSQFNEGKGDREKCVPCAYNEIDVPPNVLHEFLLNLTLLIKF